MEAIWLLLCSGINIVDLTYELLKAPKEPPITHFVTAKLTAKPTHFHRQ